jgi:hypothetical protein
MLAHGPDRLLTRAARNAVPSRDRKGAVAQSLPSSRIAAATWAEGPCQVEATYPYRHYGKPGSLGEQEADRLEMVTGDVVVEMPR